MANGADGSIIIDTSLDNTGFAKGSDKLDSAVKGLTNSVNAMGKDMGKSIESVAPTLRAVGEASQQAAQSLTQADQQAQAFRDDMSGAVSSSDFDKSISATGRSCTSLAGQLQKIGDSARVGFKNDAQILRFQMQVEKARDNVTNMQQSLEALGRQKISFQDYEELAAATKKAE
ncbi:MAG: hypothetical protein EOM54_13365, partial [Clostridia bacterium]|nr:hypothetical protein [Clostridia bacterium]